MNNENNSQQRVVEGQGASRNANAANAVDNCCLLTIARQGVTAFSVVKLNVLAEGDAQQQPSKATDVAVGKEEIKLQQVAFWQLPEVEVAEFSQLGDLLGIASGDCLHLINPRQNFKEIAKIKTGPVQKLMFSPLSTYAVVLTPFTPNTNEKNLKVYKSQDQQSIVAEFSVRSAAAVEKWPTVMWSNNERFCFKMGSNEVQVFPGDLGGFPTPSSRIPADKIEAFSPSIELQDSKINVAVFTRGSKDSPSCIKVFVLDSPTSTAMPLNSKVFHNVESIAFHWNYTGTTLLAVTHSEVDRTGKSYYGTSSLYFLEAKADGQALLVIGADKGPVLDCHWLPSANDFIVISGAVPSSIQLYDGKKAEPKLSFGSLRRNTCRLNPFGRFILLAGFGNLAGDFDVWDTNKKKIIGSGKAACAVDCSWAPDGRIFLCATTTPRMRVDNQVKIFRYNGDLLAKMDMNDLYFAKWIPCKPGAFPNRGASPGRTAPKPSGADEASSGVYRPPRATASFDSRMQAQRQAEAQTGVAAAVAVTATTRNSNMPPGADYAQPLSKSAKKNAARKAKKHKEAAEAGGLP